MVMVHFVGSDSSEYREKVTDGQACIDNYFFNNIIESIPKINIAVYVRVKQGLIKMFMKSLLLSILV